MNNNSPISILALHNKYRLIVIMFSCALLVMLTFSPASKADSIVGLNSIKQQTNNSYLTDGTDSYIVFKLDASEQVRQAQVRANHISLDLSLVAPKRTDELAIEVFFKPLNQDNQLTSQQRFDPLYRLKLKVPPAALEVESGELLIAIPDNVLLSVDQEIRVDIDQCNNCSLQINAAPKLISHISTSTPVANQVFAYRVFNGAKQIPKTGISVDSNAWHLNDIVRLNSSLKIDGGDPYLVSHDLDINTQELGGVLFSFKFQKPSNEARDYQLFYATDSHAFIENASSGVRVLDNNEGISRFVIPLQFLSESAPRAGILERLRIDLLPSEDDIELWSIAETTLLNKAQMAKYSDLVPARTIHNKRQRAHGLVLLKNVVKKILADPWFVFFYLLMIALTAVGFWRQFKR